MPTLNVVNLDDLDTMAHAITWRGVTYPVRSITVRVENMIAALGKSEGVQAADAAFDIMAKLLPTMTRDEITDLSVPQMQAIITLARTQVGVVEEAAASPNADSPAPKKKARRPARTSSGA